jgi:hypothetical protein
MRPRTGINAERAVGHGEHRGREESRQTTKKDYRGVELLSEMASDYQKLC